MEKKEFLESIPKAMELEKEFEKSSREMQDLVQQMKKGVISNLLLAHARAIIVVKKIQKAKSKFGPIYKSLSKFVDSNFDWCQDHSSQEKQNFLEMR